MALERYRPLQAPALRPVPVPVPQIGRTFSLHDHVLRAYLPWFTTNHFRTQPDVDIALDTWLRSSPDILESTSYHPLRERDLQRAYYMVIDSMEEAQLSGEGMSGIARRLLMELEDAWKDDMMFGSGRAGGKAQRMFRALAELSNKSRSGGLGIVLRAFLLGSLDDITDEEDAIELAGWCSGVERSYMDGRDKEECLRAIMTLRPDVIDELEGRSVDWMPAHAMGFPAREWPRRRRAAGRSWWDDDIKRRLRRLLDEDDYHDRLSYRERAKLNLVLRGSSFDRRARRASRTRLGRSMDRALLRSRSPRYRYLTDSDDDERLFRRGRRRRRPEFLHAGRIRSRDRSHRRTLI